MQVEQNQSSFKPAPAERCAPAPRPDSRTLHLPELLAPAGDWDCVRAAVENGADAVYFGLDRFNARMRANNFTEGDLPKLMEYLHRRGVKGYLTLNTLVFQDELAEAEGYLRAMILAGVDAVIVQDVGLCRLIRELSPDFPIHASTQMTVTSARGLAFAKALGCNLVVLARECSLGEIEKMRTPGGTGEVSTAPGESVREGSAPMEDHLPIEVFVHGALCVAYSGQCLTSEALGGRSANRGECAQACRMPYELFSDGVQVPLNDRRYLLSPQDLAGLEVLPQLVQLGVASLKIEGRLKTPEYVANITRVYRKALNEIDATWRSRPEQSTAPNIVPTVPSLDELVAASRYDLEMAFSRGLYSGWFRGVNKQQLVHAHFGKKRGVYLGQVRRLLHGGVGIKLVAPLKPGDGVVFDAGHPEEKEEGGRVYSVDTGVADSVIGFGRGDVDFQRIHVGDKLWKTSDPELENRLRRSFSTDQPQFRRPVTIDVHGTVGQPLSVVVRDEMGRVVQVTSTMPLAQAETQPLTTDRLRDQLGRLGGTIFELGELRNHLEGGGMLPLRELNRLRREWVAELEAQRAKHRRWRLREEPLARVTAPAHPGPAESGLSILVRDLPQLEVALEAEIQMVYCEFEDPKKYREAVRRFREWQTDSGHPPLDRRARCRLYVAPPRITKAGEDWILKQVRSCDADGYLVRNYDQLGFFAGAKCVGDYSLNVANGRTAKYFLETFGLERFTASYDLNAAQLEALVGAVPVDRFEVTLHQHMPMFHMEHCVFCAFLSQGTDYTNCGRPCDRHQVQLQDRVGARHPVKADAGCRNTVYNARAQTGAEHFGRLQQLGVRHFRVEFLDESPDLVRQTLRQYQGLLSGRISGASLWRELRLLNQLGVTRGTVGR